MAKYTIVIADEDADVLGAMAALADGEPAPEVYLQRVVDGAVASWRAQLDTPEAKLAASQAQVAVLKASNEELAAKAVESALALSSLRSSVAAVVSS